jgi:septum formation inhibitor MinC
MDIPAKSKSSDLGKRRQEEPRGVTQPKGKCPWGSLVPYTPSKTHFSKDDRDPVLRRIEDEGAIRLILKSTRSKKQNQLVKNATERLIATLEQTQHSDNLVLAEFTKPSNHILSRVSALYRDIEQDRSDYKSTLTLVSGCMEDAIETAFEKLQVWNEDDEATAMRQDPAYTETNPSSSYDSTAPLSLKYPARSGHQSVPVRQGARDIVEFVTEEM